MNYCNRYKQRKTCLKKISKKLMSASWHLRGWWDWCMPEDEKKKEIKQYLTEQK